MPRARSSSSPGSSAPARRSYRPLTTEPILHPGRSATVEVAASRTASSRSPASSASCTRASPRRGSSAAGASIVAELSVAGPQRRASLARRAVRAAAALPADRARPDRRRARLRPGRRRDAPASARPAAPLLEDVTLVGTYRGQPLGPDERSLTFRLRFGAPRSGADRRRGRRGDRGPLPRRWRTDQERESAPEPATLPPFTTRGEGAERGTTSSHSTWSSCWRCWRCSSSATRRASSAGCWASPRSRSRSSSASQLRQPLGDYLAARVDHDRRRRTATWSRSAPSSSPPPSR